MKRAAALIVACLACGQIEQSNNGLAGKWLSATGDDCALTLELSPGPDGVEGTGSASIDCFGSFSVSTLSDHQTMRWTSPDGVTQDFTVRAHASPCGLPLTKTPPDQVRAIDLVPVVPAPGSFAMTFLRDAPEPKCSLIFPPSG
ncbi:MAG TPA: hypothetical protein VGH20_11500 [Myxococcales bacterium]|jgi:hypothetical protein